MRARVLWREVEHFPIGLFSLRHATGCVEGYPEGKVSRGTQRVLLDRATTKPDRLVETTKDHGEPADPAKHYGIPRRQLQRSSVRRRRAAPVPVVHHMD